CRIEDCIMHQPSLNNVFETTLMKMSAGEASDGRMAYHRACVIRNCFVDSDYKQNPVRISQITVSGGVATVTTSLPHGRQLNDWVMISGVSLNGSTNNSFNGSYQITSPTTYGFQYTPNPAQSTNPDATNYAWMGKFSSQWVPISN